MHELVSGTFRPQAATTKKVEYQGSRPAPLLSDEYYVYWSDARVALLHKDDPSVFTSNELYDFYQSAEKEGAPHFFRTCTLRLDYDAFRPLISADQQEKIEQNAKEKMQLHSYQVLGEKAARWDAMQFAVSNILKRSSFVSEFRDRYGMIAMPVDHKMYNENLDSVAEKGVLPLVCLSHVPNKKEGAWEDQPVDGANAKFFAFAAAKGLVDETRILDDNIATLGVAGLKFRKHFLHELELLKQDGVEQFFKEPLQLPDTLSVRKR